MHRRRPFEDVPRPSHHRLLGHLPEWVGKRSAENVLETLLSYAEECGPMVRVSLGPANLVLLSDPEPIGELLRAEEANVKGWPYVLTRVVLDNVLLLNGDAWAKHRRLYRKALLAADVPRAGAAALEAFLPTLTPDRRADLSERIPMLVADCVTELLCGVKYDRGLEEHRARVQYELAAVGIDLQCQPWTYFSPRRWVQMRRSVAAMRRFFRGHVDARLARPEPNKKDILGGFVKLVESGEFPRDPEALTDGMVNFFFTAHDVLSSSTSWCLHLLAEHKEAQDAARLDDEALSRAVRESLRLHPGYPLFSRQVQEDLEVSGYRIPRGTNVIVSPWVLHRLERHWPDAQRFDPDRWIGNVEPVRPNAGGPYMPFGGGFRSCIAFALALPLLEQIVGRVIREVRLEGTGHAPRLVYWGSTSSANGLPVTVRSLPEDASVLEPLTGAPRDS